MFGDEIEFDEESCPKCSAPDTLHSPCTAMGCNEGLIDMHEYDDPLWFDEGEEEMCTECFGTGYLHWCKECGFDFQDPRNKSILAKARP